MTKGVQQTLFALRLQARKMMHATEKILMIYLNMCKVRYLGSAWICYKASTLGRRSEMELEASENFVGHVHIVWGLIWTGQEFLSGNRRNRIIVETVSLFDFSKY